MLRLQQQQLLCAPNSIVCTRTVSAMRFPRNSGHEISGAAGRASPVRREMERHEVASRDYDAGSKILELAQTAYSSYVAKNPHEQARLIKTLVSNSTFDRGSLSLPTLSRSTCWRRERNWRLAGRQGFEPRYRGPEPRVLPLDDLPVPVRRARRARTFDYMRSKAEPASTRDWHWVPTLLTRDVEHAAALAGVARVLVHALPAAARLRRPAVPASADGSPSRPCGPLHALPRWSTRERSLSDARPCLPCWQSHAACFDPSMQIHDPLWPPRPPRVHQFRGAREYSGCNRCATDLAVTLSNKSTYGKHFPC